MIQKSGKNEQSGWQRQPEIINLWEAKIISGFSLFSRHYFDRAQPFMRFFVPFLYGLPTYINLFAPLIIPV